MRTCSKGIWNESIPGIVFDQNGESNFYKLQIKMMRDFPRGEKGHKDWEGLVAKMKKHGKNRKYDCIIGVSGGVDSSNLLCLAKDYGLRPLAVNLDNGFNSEIAVQNIFKITKALNIDLETYVIDYEEVKSLLKAYMRAGLPWADYPTDMAIRAVMYKYAMKENVRYIIRGNDFRSEGKQPKEWTYSDSKQLKHIQRKFGEKIKLKTFPQLPLLKIVYAGLIRRVMDIRPYYYLDYTKQDAKKMLINKYDWRDYGGHHHENLFTKYCMSYWLPKKFGIDKRIINLSAQIISGAITRDDALNQIELALIPVEDEAKLRDYVIKKLDLEVEEYDRIWNGTNHTFLDYPSDYKVVYNMARLFKPLIRKLYAFTPMSIEEKEVIGSKDPE